MKISVNDLSFGFTNKLLFNHINIEIESGKRPLVILGPSGSGKTTLLKLLGGLLKPESGEIVFYNDRNSGVISEAPNTAFMFQEPRLLPWLTILDNVLIPIKKCFKKEEALERAKQFLSLVSLYDKMYVYPPQLSGGQAQRVSMARAFAWPASALYMDEPFQSLDIPLRIKLMDLTLSFQEKENRLLIIVTHDTREAVYMGERIIVLGKQGEGIVFDKQIELDAEERSRIMERELEILGYEYK